MGDDSDEHTASPASEVGASEVGASEVGASEVGESRRARPEAPVLRVISRDATPEQVAALVAVFSAMGGGEDPTPPRRPQWSAPHRLHRRTLPHGPGGWRASGLPR